MPMHRETLFLHRKTRTLIASDLLANVGHSPHWWTRTYLRAMGVRDGVGVSRVIKLGFRDRKAARESLDRALAWDFDRLIVSHGAIVETGGQELVREHYAWL